MKAEKNDVFSSLVYLATGVWFTNSTPVGVCTYFRIWQAGRALWTTFFPRPLDGNGQILRASAMATRWSPQADRLQLMCMQDT
jgi:hypothetical protein